MYIYICKYIYTYTCIHIHICIYINIYIQDGEITRTVARKRGYCVDPGGFFEKSLRQTNLCIVTIFPCSLGIVLGTNLPGRARTRSHACFYGIMITHKSVCSLSRPQERKVQRLNTRRRKHKIQSSKVTHIVCVLGPRSDEVAPLRPEPTDTSIFLFIFGFDFTQLA